MNTALNALREPVLRQAIRTLDLPQNSRGLDAGCGLGFQTLLLIEALGAGGHITGLDLSADFLDYAQKLAARQGHSDSIEFREGDVKKLPFENDTFDWAWSVDLIGYAPLEPLPLLEELFRVVKPGGKIALLAWSSERLLPGFPELEAHLSATTAGIAPFIKGKQPKLHFTRALGWFRELNMRSIDAHTFAGGLKAPLSELQRGALEDLFEMRWPEVEAELTPADWKTFQRLTTTGSQDYILDNPDYYAFFTYTMFHGTVPE